LANYGNALEAFAAILWHHPSMRVHGGVLLSLLVLAGCGGDSASLASDEPWGAGFVREQVVCGGGDISLAFTLTDVTVWRGKNALASASLGGRSLSGDCESATAADSVRESTRWSEPVYENTKLACHVPGSVAIQTHPIMERNKPSGTTLLVLHSDRGDLVASVPLKAGGSRLYYDTSLCTRSS
jgi:hypothetical protein